MSGSAGGQSRTTTPSGSRPASGRTRTQSWAGRPLSGTSTVIQSSTGMSSRPHQGSTSDLTYNGTSSKHNNRNPTAHSATAINASKTSKNHESTRVNTAKSRDSGVGKSTNGHSRGNSRTANETFNSFVEDCEPYWQNDLSAAYNQVTGVSPSAAYVPSRASTQYQLLQQQKAQKQQEMIEQSKALLEASKAKHQAMIAQAHAAAAASGHKHHHNNNNTDHHQHPETAMSKYAPRPPAEPPKKPANSGRMARYVLLHIYYGLVWYVF